MSDKANMRLLFQKVQHTGLRGSSQALKYSQTTGTTILYTMAANDFPITTSKITEYIEKNTINVLGVQEGDAAKGGDGIYNEGTPASVVPATL